MERYLGLLGIDTHPAGLDGLRLIIRRHLAIIPFENVSKLLLYSREGAGRPTTFKEYLDAIEHHDLGGTCYTNNPFLADLLRYLGYDADLLGADMSRANVHTCVRVRLDSITYHVDVGFASPFRDPYPLNALPAVVDEGENRYVFEPGADGEVRLTMSTRGTPHISYRAHYPPRQRQFFEAVVRDSFGPGQTFMNILRICRVFDTYSVDLIDSTLYRHDIGVTSVTELSSIAELKSAVANELRMPRCPIETAVDILQGITGRPFFRDAAVI